MRLSLTLFILLFSFQSYGEDVVEVVAENGTCLESETMTSPLGKKFCHNWSESTARISIDCDQAYVPPHSKEDIEDVKAWAVGRAFLLFADKAGYKFDGETYGEDNPYLGLFNFGLATARTCLSSDVVSTYNSMIRHLMNVFSKYDDGTIQSKFKFKAIFKDLADAYKMDDYLTPEGTLL